jgi:hypothetical protein
MRLSPVLLALLLASPLAAADSPAVAKLKEALAGALDASPAAEAKVKTFAKDKLLPLVTDEVWVREIKAQNAKKVTLDEIKKIDEAWIKAEEELPIQKEKLSNACAQEVRKIASAIPALRETFVMDDQGANVGQNNLTSDFWQGDEDKWQKTFAGGKGGIDIGKAKFDKSANATLQQVSLPIIDADGSVIGAVTFGIAIDSL